MTLRGKCGTGPRRGQHHQTHMAGPRGRRRGTRARSSMDGRPQEVKTQLHSPIPGSGHLEATTEVVCAFSAAPRRRLGHLPLLRKPSCCYSRIPVSCYGDTFWLLFVRWHLGFHRRGLCGQIMIPWALPCGHCEGLALLLPSQQDPLVQV